MTSNAGEPDRTGVCIGGKYRLEAPIAEGGTGRVYRARHEMLGREVAVKVLLACHAERPELVARFVREARMATAVRHPNVVEVLDVGIEPTGLPYMVQELLQGQSLAQHLSAAGGVLGFAQALTLMEPVIDAVAFAHARGVTHRDLKPENVFLVRENDRLVPKVLDFGISRRVTPERTEGDSMVGLICGTPLYMSPEQGCGEATDARTDVWSLGVILHELLSGTLPFPGNTDAAVLAGIFYGEPAPLEIAAPDVPDAIRRIVTRCLRRHPMQRYPSARELLADLRDVMRTHGIASSVPASVQNARALEGTSAPPTLEWGIAEVDVRASGDRVGTPRAAMLRRVLTIIVPLAAAGLLGVRVMAGHTGSERPAIDRAQGVTTAAAESGPRPTMTPHDEPAKPIDPAPARSTVHASASNGETHPVHRIRRVRRAHRAASAVADNSGIPPWPEVLE